jgi:hypothetical protein
MKKYILLIIMIAGMAVSCNDMLELIPDGRTSLDEIFSTRNGIRGYLNSCYAYRPGGTGLLKSSLSDEAQDADGIMANSQSSWWYNGTVTSSLFNSVVGENAWSYYYEGIRKCNVFLQRIQSVKAANISSSEAEVNGWKAQAYTLRALYYLQLAKRYGAVPLLTEEYSASHDYTTDRKADFSEVVAAIIRDCDEALATPNVADGFAWNLYTGQDGLVSRAVAYAIKSQAVTYAASPLWADGTWTWANATAINGEALYQCLTHDYSLFRNTPAPNIAQNAYAWYFITIPDIQRSFDKETIYNGPGLNMWQNAGLPTTPGQTVAGPCPTQELVDCYEMVATGEPPILEYSDEQHLSPVVNTASGYNPTDPYAGRDPRFYASLYYNNAIRELPSTGVVETFEGGKEGISTTNRRFTRTGYYVRKYSNWQSGRDNPADGVMRLFRLAELYLNFAESACQSHGPDEVITLGAGMSMSARDAVNAVRARAGMPGFPAGMSKDAFEKKYRNERRVELAFEDHRYFDVRRWKILESTEHYVTGMRIINGGGNLQYNRIVFERGSYRDKFYLYPLSPEEAIKMSNYTGVNWQNPEWE